MDRSNPYYRQVHLLVQMLPLVAREQCFALKGGTAINLFVRDFPRLSVDIDLVYLPGDDREAALSAIRQALDRIASDIVHRLKGTRVTKSYDDKPDALRLVVERGGATVKLELSPVLRGTVYEPATMRVVSAVEDEFGFAEVPVVSFEDLYAGKLCAALDRQHPRDLFDVKLLLENEGLTDRLRKAFLVYLVSHHRPIEELLDPHLKDLEKLYAGEFRGMTLVDVPIEELKNARVLLLEAIMSTMSRDEKRFLASMYGPEPDVTLLGLDGVADLPAFRWKVQNIARMSSSKRAASRSKLEMILSGEDDLP
jgi:predicted nucleotidyltransferase component of viral defense system